MTLAVQNAALTLIMHYSRVSSAPSQTYSAAAAVLLVELLKGSISLLVAFSRIDSYSPQYNPNSLASHSPWTPRGLLNRFSRLGKEVFRPDCWKLSIPSTLLNHSFPSFYACYLLKSIKTPSATRSVFETSFVILVDITTTQYVHRKYTKPPSPDTVR